MSDSHREVLSVPESSPRRHSLKRLLVLMSAQRGLLEQRDAGVARGERAWTPRKFRS